MLQVQISLMLRFTFYFKWNAVGKDVVSKQQPRDAGMFVLPFKKVMFAAKGHLLMALLLRCTE